MSIAVRKCHEGVCKVHSSKLEVQNSKEMHWRPWVPAIGRNKERMGGGVPLGTEYWLGWLSVVGWTRILGLAGWMQAGFDLNSLVSSWNCFSLIANYYLPATYYRFNGIAFWRPWVTEQPWKGDIIIETTKINRIKPQRCDTRLAARGCLNPC